MKDRNIACQHYLCEGTCVKGHDGTFWSTCQHCGDYFPVAGGKPARKNLKREKQMEQKKRDLRDTIWE
jgi:hypothetical protein